MARTLQNLAPVGNGTATLFQIRTGTARIDGRRIKAATGW